MSKLNILLIHIFIFIKLLHLIQSQINVLAPPSVVQKVKELEDGSKKQKYNLNKFYIKI